MKYLLVLSMLMLAIGCDKPDEPFVCEGDLMLNVNEDAEAPSIAGLLSNVYIVNEGGFTNGNASVDMYNPSTGEVTNGLFEMVNGFPLGDILQSITFNKEEAYLVVNNSQKIEVVNTITFERLRTISNFSSPRYVLPSRIQVQSITSSRKVILTDFLANQIQNVDLRNGCVANTLDRVGWTEQIFRVGTSFWILERSLTGAANEFAQMVEVDNELNLLSEVDLPIEPNSIALDRNNNLWVLSSGKESENILPSLIHLNTSSKQIDLELEFTDWTDIPLNLVADYDREKLYFNRASDIYSMDITATALPATILFGTAAQNIYALSIPLEDNHIYVSDAIDFIQNGAVSIYTDQGVYVNSFGAGVIPSKVVSSN